jgi:DedD protein
MEYSRDEDGLPRKERELTLSMSAILGIFFGLVLLCGLFFGLGYNMRGRQISAAAGTDADADNSTNPQFNNFKPAAGSPAGNKPVVVVTPDSPAPGATTPANAGGTVHAVATPAASGATGSSGTPSAPAPIVRLAPAPATGPTGHSGATGTVVVTAAPAATPVSAAGPAPTPPVSASFIVQVAAVSHQEDADLLMGALKGRGYSVSARTEPQDKLVHIQIGPFSNRKDAEAMRQRLMGDGYNAIIK